MKSSRISIKWKTFSIFLIFTIVLLSVLWFFQIVYLDDFYKTIKRQETEEVLNSVEDIIRNSDDCAAEIEDIAAKHNLGIFITDTEARNAFYHIAKQLDVQKNGKFLNTFKNWMNWLLHLFVNKNVFNM